MTGIDEAFRRRFEAHRLEGGGEPLEEFLPSTDAPSFAATLEELVAIDLEFRWRDPDRDGESPSVDDYVDRFPSLAAQSIHERLGRVNEWIRREFAGGDALAPKTRIGRYELRRRVGRGAFAEVWLARDDQLDRDVAMKFLKPELAGDETARARLVREAQSAAKLRHPSIVPVHEVVEHDGRRCIVSDFVSGTTLAEALRERTFDPDEAARLVARLADALQFAHENGVVHRDVKPDNVMLSDTGLPVLTDFGLAQLKTSDATLTRHGEILGTPAYMPPEQARGDSGDVGPRSDVYSLGALLYELLCGERPFGAASTPSVLYLVIHKDPAPPRSFAEGVPPDLETVCLKAMAKDPARRYATAKAFAEDLRRYLDRRPIRARSLGVFGRGRLWVERNPLTAATLAGSALVLTIVVVVAFVGVLNERDRYLAERKRADANLYESLLGEALSLVRSRDSDWYAKAMDRVARATELEVENRDELRLRDLVVRCEGSEYPSYHPVDTWASSGGVATQLSIDAEGRRAAALMRGGGLRIRDVATGSVVASRDATQSGVRRVAIHPSGRFLAAGGEDGRVELLDAATLEPVWPPLEGDEQVEALAFSPFGDRLAVSRMTGPIQVFARNPETLSAIGRREIEGHPGGTVSLAFSPDGTELASGGRDSTIHVRAPGAEAPRIVHTLWDPPTRLAYSPSGTTLAFTAAQDFGFGLLELEGEGESKGKGGMRDLPLRDVFFDSRRRVVTVSGDGSVSAWDLRFKLLAEGFAERQAATAGAVVPGTAKTLVAYEDGTVRVWEITERTGRRWFSTHHDAAFVPRTSRLVTSVSVVDFDDSAGVTVHDFDVEPITALDAAASGDVVACGRADGSVLAWRLDDPGAEPSRWNVPGGEVEALRVIGDGLRVAVRMADGTERVVGEGVRPGEAVPEGLFPGGVVALRRGRLAVARGTDIEIAARRLRGHSADVSLLAFSPDADRLASLDTGGNLHVWNVDTGERTLSFEAIAQDVKEMALGPGERFAVLLQPFSTLLVDLRTARVEPMAATAVPRHATFARDGESLVIGFAQGQLAEWETKQFERGTDVEDRGRAQTWQRRTLVSGSAASPVWGVAASPDGRWWATTAHTGNVTLWDAKTLAPVRDLQGDGDISWTADFSPDSQVLAVGSGRDVVLVQLPDGERTRFEGHKGLVKSVAFHPTRPLVVSSSNDGTVRVWDTLSGDARGVLHEGASVVHSLAFRPDGTRLAGASSSGDLFLWDATTDAFAKPGVDPPDPVERLDDGGSALWAVTYDDSGRYLASGALSGVVTLRDARSLDVLVRLRSGIRRVRNLSFDAGARRLAVSTYVDRNLTWDLDHLLGVLRPMGLAWDANHRDR